MLIECPFCHTRAKLSESQEGAKVRCSECGKVYRARARGGTTRVSSSGTPRALALTVGAVLLLVVGFLFVRGRDRGTEHAAAAAAARAAKDADPAPAADAADQVDATGWDSELVGLARELHDLAHRARTERLRERLHGPLLWARATERAEDDLEALRDGFRELPREEQLAVLDGAALELVAPDDPENLAASWVPFDGEVVEETAERATVRLDLGARDPERSTAKRTIQWFFAREGAAWKAAAWSRPDRAAAEGADDEPSALERVVLTDGSKVVEREPARLDHLPDTPPAVAERIDELIEIMLDPEQTVGASRAQRELTELGRPAIPILLTRLYDNPLANLDDAVQANQVVQTLRAITGQSFGFTPTTLVGSTVGTTEERRASAVRQWFAWWYVNGDRFANEPAPEPDEERGRR